METKGRRFHGEDLLESKSSSPLNRKSAKGSSGKQRSQRRRARCFVAAEQDETLLRDRQRLTDFYLDEVEVMSSECSADTVPAHVPVLRQTSQKKTVRVLQWNINVLHGADNVDFSLPQPAGAVAALIESLNADVVLLQEAWKLGYSADASPPWPDSADRVQELLAELRNLGYRLIATEHTKENNNFNPCVLATKLPVLELGPTFSTDSGCHEFAEGMLASRIPELRAARLVELGLCLPASESKQSEEKVDPSAASTPTLTAVITHFHHNEAAAASRGFGIRKGEAQAIVDACDAWHNKRRQRLDTCGAGPSAVPAATILATDFNGVRPRDFLCSRDWEMHERCMERINQPADDGVATCLESSGFKCTYDAPGMVAPTLTHWTNAVVDFAYIREEKLPSTSTATQAQSWNVKGTYVVPTTLSDHLPVVHDLVYSPPRP